ncbi:hypothetical protein CLU96_1884 [Chryseobacterium sp. 52]|nr:hypothetical protein [Chryseobacterium sp. 52]PIF44888.1 hypothetical protein CLU96_1884 [Chryseobacterium sp. 52]
MKAIQKLVQLIIKRRVSGVITLFSQPIVVHEWVLFGKLIIRKSFKTY